MDVTQMTQLLIGPLAGAAIAVGVLVLWLRGHLPPFSGAGTDGQRGETRHETLQFLFADGTLIDANPPAASVFSRGDWAAFQSRFGDRFDTLGDAGLSAPATLRATAPEDSATLTITPERRWTRVDVSSDDCPALIGQVLHETRRDLEHRQAALNAATCPIWSSGPDGRPDWCNAAYEALQNRVRGRQPDTDGPCDPVFDLTLREDATQARNRLAVTTHAPRTTLWFDVESRQVYGQWLHFATDINAVVNSEIAQRNFVQTLTKTFAHLSIGLAIFDRNRQLALFNPALIDLTALPADFLSLRPDLFSFFDRLRDRRMMPEPKNYSDWREQLTALVTEASHGQYCDTWTLPSGLTYRVSGRPHPDGAIAFLFEDISAEISLTRRFRSELELGQAVLDTVDEAIAVFSPLGTLSLTNADYDAMWPQIDGGDLSEVNILNSTRIWQAACRATPVWGDLRNFVTDRRERTEWRAEVERTDGTRLACRFVPLAGGATLVGFATPDAGEKAAETEDSLPILA